MSMLAAEPIVDWDWVRDHTDDIWEASVEHLELTAFAVTVGFAVAMGLAIVALRWPRTYGPLAGLMGALYAIPSLALFAVFVPITGLGFRTAEIGLVSYTLLILLRNIVEGVEGVPASVREAADGMGFPPWRRFVSVDLRLATPTIVAGIRIATVTTVGLVTVAALVGTGGYGDLINNGLSRDFPTPITVGAVLSVVLAIALDVVFVGVERLLTPWRRSAR